MESAQAENDVMGGEQRKELGCSFQIPLARKYTMEGKPAGTTSLFKKQDLYTSSLTLSFGKVPEQIVKQTVDTKPEENIGIRREDEFVKNKLP